MAAPWVENVLNSTRSMTRCSCSPTPRTIHRHWNTLMAAVVIPCRPRTMTSPHGDSVICPVICQNKSKENNWVLRYKGNTVLPQRAKILMFYRFNTEKLHVRDMIPCLFRIKWTSSRNIAIFYFFLPLEATNLHNYFFLNVNNGIKDRSTFFDGCRASRWRFHSY